MNESISANVSFAVEVHAQRAPDSLALVHGARTMTYAELESSVCCALDWLVNSGVRPGMVVGLLFSDSITALVAMLALMRMGATPFPLSPRSLLHQQQDSLDSVTSHLVISDMPESRGLNARILTFEGPCVVGASEKVLEISKDPDAICLLVSGTGSTGVSLQIPVSHRTMAARCAMLRELWSLRDSDRVMVLSPPYFATPTYRILAAFSGGATAIVWDKSPLIPSRIMKYAPDILHLSVFHAEKLLENKCPWPAP